MSFRVLVIPEDPTHNGYILKPLIERIVSDAGKPNATVNVLTNPRLEGFDHATKAIRDELPGRYGFWDLWVFVPDGDRATPQIMEGLESDMAARGVTLFCCPAQPEVEIYACVAYREELGARWDEVRKDLRFKEHVFHPLLAKVGDARRAGGGRDQMIYESLRKPQALYRLCPELSDLCDRIGCLRPRG